MGRITGRKRGRVRYGAECITAPCTFHMVVDGQVKLIASVLEDDIVIAGSDKTCRYFHTALIMKFPTNNLGDLTWHAGCAFKRDWKMETLAITQKTYIESILNRVAVNSSPDTPATPSE